MPNRIAAQPLSVPVTMRMTTISAIIVRIARSAIPMFFVMNAPGGDRVDGGRVGAPFNLYVRCRKVALGSDPKFHLLCHASCRFQLTFEDP